MALNAISFLVYLNIVQPLVCKALMRLRRASIILVGRGLLVKMLIILEPRLVSFDQVVHPYTFPLVGIY